ncbi:MAG: metal ABC transporter permease [Planctomycetes bacterium]|nr:metal ABC transporter permease [Planctomycetota bacterium]MBI3844427.1 metal ABC transporter permease [Planctomycetota bacterium]
MQSLLNDLALFQNALFGGLIVAMVLGLLGVHVLLRRIVFVGIALSQWAAVGIALSFLAEGVALFDKSGFFGLCRNHWIMAVAAEMLGLALLLRGDERHLSRETRIGIGWAVAGSAAVLCVTHTALGMEELKNLLTGEVLFLSREDLVLLAVTAAPVIAMSIALQGRFFLIAFDRDLALSLGVHVRLWDGVFYLLLGIILAISIHMVGVLFAVGFLILPAAAALSLARHRGSLPMWSVGIAGISYLVGFVVSHPLDLPTGPSAVAVAGIIFIVAASVHRFRA